MSKKSAHPHRITINVNNFDDPFNRATNYIAVVGALALAKAETDGAGDSDMWYGISELMERALADANTMSSEYIRVANYVYELEERAGIKPAGNRYVTGTIR